MVLIINARYILKMKTIKLKISKEIISVNGNEQTIILVTINILRDVVNNMPPNGYNITEMMQRLKILGLIEPFKSKFKIPEDIENISDDFFSVENDLLLEDADYEALKDWAKNMHWGILSKFIVDFVNSFE